jgi:hypothetical protein
MMVGALLVGAILAIFVAAHAQVSVSVFGISKHSEGGYCEVNPGVGINYQINDDLRFGHGRDSRTASATTRTLPACPIARSSSARSAFGVAFLRLTGYGPTPIYAPLPIGAYTINQHNAIDFFVVTSGELTVAGGAWRYTF